MANGSKKVTVPSEIFDMMFRAHRQLDVLSESFADFISAHNPSFLKRMRVSRRLHLQGKLGDWESLKAKLHV